MATHHARHKLRTVASHGQTSATSCALLWNLGSTIDECNAQSAYPPFCRTLNKPPTSVIYANITLDLHKSQNHSKTRFSTPGCRLFTVRPRNVCCPQADVQGVTGGNLFLAMTSSGLKNSSLRSFCPMNNRLITRPSQFCQFYCTCKACNKKITSRIIIEYFWVTFLPI